MKNMPVRGQRTATNKASKPEGVKQAKIGTVMREFKEGGLHSGKGGPVVKNPKQAIAIAISEGKKAAYSGKKKK